MVPYHANVARSAVLVATILLAFGAPAAAQQNPERQPPPDAAAQGEALELIREVYGQDLESVKTTAEKNALAKKMLDQARQAPGDRAAHFVLLRMAKEVAVEAAEAETALAAVDEIAGAYDVDAAAMRLGAFLGAAGNARLPEQRKAIAECGIPLIRAAVSEDDYPRADLLRRTALSAARGSRDRELVKEVVSVGREVERAEDSYAQVQQALAALEKDPTDPDANLAVGRHHCIVKGDWERGIPMLALGSDDALSVPAQKELKSADSPQVCVALGDGWWDLAQTKRGLEKDALLLRAGTWYQEAKRGFLSGLAQGKVRQRLEEIGKIVGAVPKPLKRHSQLPEGTILLMAFEPDTLVSRDDKVFVTDSSGCENHGILSGATPTPDGKAGAALRFHGPDCVLLETLRAHLIQDLKGLSLSFWVRAEYFYGQQFLFNVGSTEERSIDLSFYGGEFRFLLSTSSGGQKCYGGKAKVGRWYHVVGVWDGTEQRIYVDGQATGKVPTKDLVLNAESVSTEAAQLGAQAKASRRQYRHLRGILDEVAIFKRALSDEEIRRLHQMGLKGQPLTSRR